MMDYRLTWCKQKAISSVADEMVEAIDRGRLAEFDLGAAFVSSDAWQLPLRVLDGAAVRECWHSNRVVETGQTRGIVWRHDGEILFGTVDIWSDDVATTDWSSVFEDVYTRIFRVAKRLGFPWLWRIWQYLPDINREVSGLERYRQFNQGRKRAFSHLKMVDKGHFPAACALGSASGQWSLSFMAGKQKPTFLENNRQISAFHYPSKYGKSRPMFARAVLIELPQQMLLLVSGTASIVGHESMHEGDVAAQTRECLHNIRALCRQAGHISSILDWENIGFDYRVYVRHAEDLSLVRAVMHEHGIDDAVVTYVQADVCRRELLVEIEAQALQDMTQVEQ